MGKYETKDLSSVAPLAQILPRMLVVIKFNDGDGQSSYIYIYG